MGFKGLAALSDTSDTMVKELAKMLLEKAESGDNRSLKDIWAAYRKKELQVEVKMNRGVSDPEPETETISEEVTETPSQDIVLPQFLFPINLSFISLKFLSHKSWIPV